MIGHDSSVRLLAALGISGIAEAEDSAPPAAESADALWDNELARRVSGDPDAFLALYERYYERVLSFLYRRTGNLDDAQDLTSRTFLLAFEALRSREQRLAFRPWLYSIAANQHTSHVRRLCRWAARVSEVGWQHVSRLVKTPREAAGERRQAQAVRRALSRLPDAYRLPILLRFDEELDYSEIALILELSESGARTRIARGLRLLEEQMKREEGR